MASDSRTVAGDHTHEPVTPDPDVLRVVPPAGPPALHSDTHGRMRMVDLQREALEARLREAAAVRERTLSERRAARSKQRVAELEGRLHVVLDERILAQRESAERGLRVEALERRLETAQAELKAFHRLRARSQQLEDLRSSRSYAVMRRVHAVLRRPFRRRRRRSDGHGPAGT